MVRFVARSAYGVTAPRLGASTPAGGDSGSPAQRPAGPAVARRLRSLVATPRGLRQALLAKEVVDPPVALRPPQQRPPGSP